MPLTVSQGEGMMVITVTSNTKSKWPALCQILGSLCCSPVSSVSQDMKGKLMHVHTALGIVQIIISVINITVENLFAWLKFYSLYTISLGPFWLGGVYLVVGIVCVLHAKFPSTCLLVITVILNLVSAALAIAALVLYSIDLMMENSTATLYCSSYSYSQTGYRLNIMMIALLVLQLCVTIIFCVLTGKVCKKHEDVKSVEVPELHKPLLEDATAGAA